MNIIHKLLITLLLGVSIQAQADKPDYTIQVIAHQLEYPWSLAFLPGGEFLITEKPGYLVQLDAQGQLVTRINPHLPEFFSAAQGGLLELALLPDFAESGRLLMSYACGNINANSICLASAIFKNNQLHDVKQIFRARPDRRQAAHYGGRIALLPDNTVVLTLGDGFNYREEAQNPANHLGKLVRLNLDGSVPTDNPFVDKDDYAPEIYSMGHRNVQGIAYEPVSGMLFSHEHGPRGGDELNVIAPGENYGWPVATHGIDYTHARISPYTHYPGMVDPLYSWSPSIAPAGMAIYEGELFPQWQGDIFIAALAAKRLFRLTMRGTQVQQAETMLAELNQRLRDVRTGPEGALYVLTDSREGKLLRLVPKNKLPHQADSQPGAFY